MALHSSLRFGLFILFCFICLGIFGSTVSAGTHDTDRSGKQSFSSVPWTFPAHQRRSTHLIEPKGCRGVRDTPLSKACAYTRNHCADEDDGVLSYFSLYYCRLVNMQPFALVLILIWLVLLFSALGTVAGAFLAVNLSAVAQHLRMSDALAGVTLLALGNGAPDIFSTISAMNQSSSSLAIGELAGAAAFVTGVVSGSMALVRAFDVVKVPLIRDAVFLFMTAAFLLFILHDGNLRLWHCAVLLTMYATYIAGIAAQHWWSSRKSRVTDKTCIAAESTENGILCQLGHETEPLLSQQEHRHSGSAIGQRDTEPWYEPDAGVVDHRQASAKALSSIHQSYRAQPTTSNERNPAHYCRHDVHANDDWQTNNNSIFSRTFEILANTHNQSKSLGALFVAAHIIMLPFTIVFKATIPRVEDCDANDGERQDGKAIVNVEHTDGDSEQSFSKRCDRLLIYVQCFASPQFMLWLVARQLSKTTTEMFLPSMICLGASAALTGIAYMGRTFLAQSRWYHLLCIPGFVVSIGWLSLLADEIVAVLKVLGIILNIPDAIAGITVFAIGNSIDDLAANISVARHRHPVMALSACFGGPLLNILIGLGISGMTVIIAGARGHHGFPAIKLNATRSLFFVLGATMFNLGLLLALMLWTRWKMTRLVGFILTGSWVVSTILNVVLEVRG